MRIRARFKALARKGGARDLLQSSWRSLAHHAASVSSDSRSSGRTGLIARRFKPSRASRTLTHELVILSLQSLKESSPIFPPLQSVVGGLLKLIDTYETMTQNEIDRQRLYGRVDTIQESLVVAWGDTTNSAVCPLSEVQVKALVAFDFSLQCLLNDAIVLAAQRQGWLSRLVLARTHKTQIADFHAKLAQADDDFRRTLELDTNLQVTCVRESISSASKLYFEQNAFTHSELHSLRIMLSTGLIGLFI
ncbi:hypothetical protein PENSPDRAFT_406302 [Peniophora sp. CONT]|nr:hypothetical protein PENSPDRAFT_406302 [Peniophora sp. CONT]